MFSIEIELAGKPTVTSTALFCFKLPVDVVVVFDFFTFSKKFSVFIANSIFYLVNQKGDKFISIKLSRTGSFIL